MKHICNVFIDKYINLVNNKYKYIDLFTCVNAFWSVSK